MCRSMVDIQSAAAEIRRGIKKIKKIETNHRAKYMSASATQGSHNEMEGSRPMQHGYSSSLTKVATTLLEFICHMGSHSVTCHLAEVTFQPLPQPKLVL